MRYVAITAATRPVEMDIGKRILRGAVFATTGLASDGAIVLPEGIDATQYLRNPVVTDRHQTNLADPARPNDPRPIAATLELDRAETEMIAAIQFADTELGREYAHLYGLNDAGTVFMRGWSIEGVMAEVSNVGFDAARKIAGPFWHEELAKRLARRASHVRVATRFEMKLVAAAAVGADRDALTRAARDGIGAAWELVARADFEQAENIIGDLQADNAAMRERIARIERDMQAMRADGASAGARGDSGAILSEIREMQAHWLRNNKQG